MRRRGAYLEDAAGEEVGGSGLVAIIEAGGRVLRQECGVELCARPRQCHCPERPAHRVHEVDAAVKAQAQSLVTLSDDSNTSHTLRDVSQGRCQYTVHA